MENKYKKTIFACFIGYIVQAIVCVFAPLLFLTFEDSYGIPIEKITLLISVTFILQILTDLASTFFVDRLGYRKCTVAAHIFAALGLILMSFLPEVIDPFLGLLISISIYAIGGGLIEVVISPIVESCPGENKDKTMSFLHSFFSWGSVLVIVLSALFFYFFGIENWHILCLIWALLPIFNAVLFMFVPLKNIISEGERGLTLGELIKNKTFWLFFIIILCAGACEAAISQWASAFTEESLGINKALGDIVGPAFFALMMGLCRLIYGKSGDKLDLRISMLVCGILCVVSYLIVSLTNVPIIALIGMGLSGFAVGLMWPGSYSLASANIKGGGNIMFALLALGGDLGCVLGPGVVGLISGNSNGSMKKGILIATLFPVILTCCMLVSKKRYKK